MVFELEGFDSSELKSVAIQRYEKGSNYGTLLQTIYEGIDNARPYSLSTAADGTLTYILDDPADPLYDFEISVPASGKAYRISDFSFQQETIEKNMGGITEFCSNTVSYKLDGVVVSDRGAQQQVDGPGYVYIHLKK